MEKEELNVDLSKGISKGGFEKVLNDIKVAVIDEGKNELNNCVDIVNEIIKKDNRCHISDFSSDELLPADATNRSAVDEWLIAFKKQLIEASDNINESYNNIETLVARIFKDWENYKIDNKVFNGDNNE